MNYKIRLLSTFTVMFLVLSVVTTVAQENTNPIARIDEFFTNIDFSGSVLIAKADQLLLNKGYGLANREWNIPNAPDTKFRIGSITAQFTGMAILLLQEQKLLSVEASVCDYVENCPDAWQNITIYHVLTHTSGIPNFTDFSDYDVLMSERSPASQTINRFINEPLDFEPGEDWSYSNSGYVLLGHIISEISGSPYEKYLLDSFLVPLNMKNTRYDRNKSIIRNRAEGYASSVQKAEYIDMSMPGGAGGLYSTTEDLFTWTRALHGGQVVSQESWDAMWEAAPSLTEGGYYGYGLFRGEIEGHLSINHGGDINGFAAFVAYYIDEDTTLIILSNQEGSSLNIVIPTVTKWLFGDE